MESGNYGGSVPELPEVETIRRDLETVLLGDQISDVSYSKGAKYQGLDGARGKVIHRLSRRGKFLLIHLSGADLVIHLGMSGRLFVAKVVRENAHVRVVFALRSRAQLVFVDVRRFGRLAVVAPRSYASFPTLVGMGPEPLSADFTLARFVEQTSRAGAPIKSRLLGQKLVAGLGNIYADEALHRARIHPAAQKLSRTQGRQLHSAIREILAAAVERRGTTFSLYRDGLMNEGDYVQRLRVFRRTGRRCRRCPSAIARTVVGGRSTHYCPNCQSGG
jgi:formamidopyrimidine-DNA glycosylase